MNDVAMCVRVDPPSGELILPDHNKVVLVLVSDLDVVDLDQISHEATVCGRV